MRRNKCNSYGDAFECRKSKLYKEFFPESELVRMKDIIVFRKKVSHGAGDFQVIFLALVEVILASISTVQIGLPVYQEVYDFCLLNYR